MIPVWTWPLIAWAAIWAVARLMPKKAENRYDRYVIRGLPVLAKTQRPEDMERARKARFWSAVSNRLESK